MARPDVVHVYRDEAGEWRWHRRAGNGKIITPSGEAFSSKASAVRAAKRANMSSVEVRLRVEE